ncbi:APC family permease [Paenibacillus sp. SC116]|uniref:APC family permease n=1 Tax=Paenibacillus sp. SC116 TaxID=2968986 RepID=UPI00215ACBDC|nr:APC family permease [Paenibacillus sp. SC116]MCR8842153.1 APC family permease [Paenibacillus sp. SC116]
MKERDQDTRLIDAKGLMVYYVTSIIGVGILIVPGIAYGIAGPASLLSWIILALLSYPIARSFSKLIVERPHSSGLMLMVGDVFGEKVGQSLNLLLAFTMIIGNPIMGIAAARYLQNIVGFDDYFVLLYGFFFMLASILLNLLGVKMSNRIQFISFLVLSIILSAIIGIALFHADFEQTASFAPHGYTAVLSAITVCFYSFLGWENATNIAGDVKDPRASYRKAVPIAVMIVGALYVLLAIALIVRIPAGAYEDTQTVLPLLLEGIVPEQVGYLYNALAIFLIMMATNAWVFSASRVIVSLAETKVLPALFARTTQKNVHTSAYLLLAVWYGVILLILASFELDEVYLIQMTNFNFFIIYLFIYGAAIKYYKAARDRLFYVVMLMLVLLILPFFEGSAIFSICLGILSFILIAIKRSQEKSVG